MKKKDFFITALKNRLYTKVEFIVKCFTIFKEEDNIIDKSFIPFKKDNKYYFFNPIISEHEVIEDASIDKPIFEMYEELAISPDDIVNLHEVINTCYGNLLANYILLVHTFKDKIQYINKRIRIPDIENFILSKLEDNIPIEDRQQNKFYVDEYIKFGKSVFYLTSISQICSQGHTEKSILPPPGLKEFRKKLLEENKDNLNDSAVIAKIDKELINFDSEYLKGDPSEDFLISKKARTTVRRKLYLMMGGEVGLDGNTVKTDLITTSLSEGWDINKLPSMYNTVRAGSFNRGAETVLGGVAMKEIFRALSNSNISEEDCNTKLGESFILNQDNRKLLNGFSILAEDKNIEVEEETNLDSYMGKKLLLRSFLYCKAKDGDYCKLCAGKLLSINPSGLAVAVNETFGSEMLSIFMAGAHAKNLEVAKLNIKTMLK